MHLELAQKIENAFATTTYPGDDNIGDTMLDDFVGQRDWRQVPLKLLLTNSVEIPLFTPEAYHFYLPAFLCASLRDPKGEHIVGGVIYGMLPSPTPYMKSNAEWAKGLFSDSQQEAVLEFLQMHKELFPQSTFNLLDEGKSELQEAVRFWSQT